MKKSTKIAWIMVVICIILGLGFVLAGIVLGGNFTEANITPEDFIMKGQNIFFQDEDDKDYSELENNITEYAGIEELDLEFGAEEVYLEVLDDISGIRVQVENGNLEGIKLKQDSEILKIRSSKYKTNRVIYIYYPKNYKFNSVELEIGAGEVNIDKLNADEIEFKCGVGSIKASLNGKQSDYNYEAECGIGNLVIGDTQQSGLAGERKQSYPNAARELKIECGIGDIEIYFEE